MAKIVFIIPLVLTALAASGASAQQKQETELLYRALQQMPEEKKEVLVLSRFQGLKYEEIAQLLGCEVGTVKTRVHRALQELRRLFEKGAQQRPA